jgi:hypothetical protein
MDPIDKSTPGSAAFHPPTPAAASISSPKICVLSPLPGNIYEVDRYYYAPAADATQGDFAALLTFANHYGHPITIFHCPDLAAFQAAHPSATIRPLTAVSPPILLRGHGLLSTSNAFYSGCAPPARGQECPESPSTSPSLDSLLSHPSRALRGFAPPSLAAAIRTSGSGIVSGIGSLSGFSFRRPPPSFSSHCPNPDGVDAPSRIMGGMGGLCSLGRSSFSNGVHPSWTSFGSGFSTSSTAEHYRQFNFPVPIPKAIPSGVIFGDCPRTAPPFHGGYPHETASVASASALATSPLRPLSHGDLSSSSPPPSAHFQLFGGRQYIVKKLSATKDSTV